MAVYKVSVPFVGRVEILIEADSLNDALAKGMTCEISEINDVKDMHRLRSVYDRNGLPILTTDAALEDTCNV